MTSAQRNSKYYVVGGPVQPDRDCYVVRDADIALYARLSEGDYCHVLAPAQTGKTSVMAHTANKLTADGVRVATVDLANIGGRDRSDDAGRWYYSVAYRICRELRIRSDMQSWWQERSGLTNMHRLREFFLDVVLADTEERVVIFIDRVGASLDRPFARQLLRAVRACYDARATNPEYQRLAFAMLGSASIDQLLPGRNDSPFDISIEINLKNFDVNQVRQLAAGLGVDQRTSRSIAEHVSYWTNGHPFLTQKIFRALARQSDELMTEETVDEVVGQLFIAPTGPREEPHLSAIGKQLLRESAGRNARLNLYRRVRKGARVTLEPGLDTHRDLIRSGILVNDSRGRLSVRNRIYADAFTTQWVSKNRPLGWRAAGMAALIASFAIGGPIWYTQYLPKPYVRMLTQPNQDYMTALDAYRRLNFLPGYGATADELFTDYLVAKSRNAGSLNEVLGFSERLKEIPDREALSEVLVAEFWDRRTMSAMQRGDRDEALLFATRALNLPTDERRQVVAELYGRDYANLGGTIRTPEPLRALELDLNSGLVTTLDRTHRVDIWQITDGVPRRVLRLTLLAEEVFPLQRRLIYQGGANGKRIVLTMETDHSRPGDIAIELRAPSGRQVQLVLSPDAEVADEGRYRFDSRRNADLRALLDENINGTWSAYFTDTQQGIGGNLTGWSIRIDGHAAEAPAGVATEAILIPEPGVARQIKSVLAPGGRRALTWSADETARGDILVWNIASGEILARIPRPENFSGARFARGQSGVFITARNTAELWDIERADLTQRITIEPSFRPVMSENGYILIVNTVLEEGGDALSIWDLEQAAEIGSLVTGSVAELVAVDSTGRYMAVSDGERLVRLWSVADGTLVHEFDHASKPIRIRFDPSGRWLLTEDAAHHLRVWSLDNPGEPLISRQGSSAWSARIVDGSILLGSLDRGFRLMSLRGGERTGEVMRHGIPVTRRATDNFVAPLLLATEFGFAVTYDGREAIKIWRLPPSVTQVEAAADAVPAPRTTVRLMIMDNTAAISPDGRQLAVATNAGDVRILPADQRALLLPGVSLAPAFIGHLDSITRTTFDPSGRLVASGSFDGSVRVWESASGAPRSFFSNHSDGAVLELVFTPDSQYVISATRRSVIVTDVDSGDQIAQLQIHSERPQLSVSRDGQRIYIAGNRGGLTRWLWRGGVTESLIGSDSGIRRAAVSADESLIVTVDVKRQIRAWDATTMTARKRVVRTPAAVDYLYLAPDNSQILVQAGVWLSLISLRPDGLEHQVTRLLERPPAAVAAVDSGMLAFVLTQTGTAQPEVRQLMLATPTAEPMDQRVEPFIQAIEARLSLTLTDWGEPLELH